MMIEKIIAGNEKAMDFEPQMVDYPNNIGLPAPLPPGHYELAISGKQNDKREAIPQIMKIFENNGVKILSLSFSNNQSVDEFIMNVVCDLSSAKCTQDDLLIRVNKSKFVKIAEMSSLEGRVFSRFSFPLTFFGEIRALAIDSDRFLHLFDDLTRTFGPKARDSLYENGRREGAEIIEALKEKLGEKWSSDRPALIENAKVLLQCAGWGKVLFHNEGAEIYKVTVKDPPSDADGNATLNNYFLHGMVAGVLESFLKEGTKLSMIREGYEEDKRNLLLYYMDKASIRELASEEEEDKLAATEEVVVAEAPRPQDSSSSERVIEKAPEPRAPRRRPNGPRSGNQEAVAAAEVNHIIQSIEQIKGEDTDAKGAAALSENDEQQQPTVSTKPIQGEMVGYGVQIVSEQQQQVVARKPPSRERKKSNNNNSSPSDTKKDYSSPGETVQS